MCQFEGMRVVVFRQVLIEAENEEALDKARVAVMALIMPADPSALALYDETQLAGLALQKTTRSEECAFCGKTGHAHAQCPKRRSKFTMAGDSSPPPHPAPSPASWEDPLCCRRSLLGVRQQWAHCARLQRGPLQGGEPHPSLRRHAKPPR